MRTTLSILLLLLLMPSVQALETLYSGSVTSGESVKAGDTTYTIIKGEGARILAQAPDHSLFIHNNTCEDGPLTRVCATHMEYDQDEREDVITLRIDSLKPKLSITRTIDQSTFEAGNGGIIHVTITNSGGVARQLTYTETLPEGFEIVDIEGSGRKTQNGFQLTKSSLAEGESVEFYIALQVNVVTDQTLSATLTHELNGKVERIYTDAIQITTTPKLVSELAIGKDEVVIGEPNNITLTFTNKEPLTATAKVSLELDPGLRITKAPASFSRINERRYEGALTFTKTNATRNRTVEYNFNFVADTIGTYRITTRGSYSAETQHELATLREEVDVEDKGIILRSNIDDNTFESGEQASLRLWLQNLNPYVEITNVVLQVDTSNFTTLQSAYIPTLGKQEHYKTHDKTFYAPIVSTTSGYTIRGDVNYNVNEHQFSDSFTFTTSVLPVKPLTLAHTHTASAVSGDDIPFTITITNPRTQDIQKARIRITPPEEFSYQGNIDVTIPLPNDAQSVHSIVLSAPRTPNKKAYSINSSVSYYNEDVDGIHKTNEYYQYNHSSTLTLNPEEFKLSISRSADDASVVVGDEILVSTTILNNHDKLTAQNINVTSQLAQGVEVINDAPSLQNLLPGESRTYTMRYRVTDYQSQSIPALSIHYSNQYGETYALNSTTLAVVGESGPIRSGPLVHATRHLPPNGSILHPLTVRIELLNNGSEDARVTLRDKNTHTLTLKAGERKNVTYDVHITQSGTHTLTPAEITYEHAGNTYRSATNTNIIAISDATLLTATRDVLSADSLNGVNVQLTITPHTNVTNITVRDATFFSPINNTIRYTLPIPPSHELEGATITFTHLGALYTLQTKNDQLTVQESLPLTALRDESGITLTNNAHDELTLTIGDQNITIAPSETKKVASNEARITYTHNGERRTIQLTNENIIKQTSPETFLDTVIALLQAIATWRR